MRKLTKTALIALALAGAASLQATSLYRVDFSGTITLANIAPGAADSSIAPGTPFSGFYQFNPALPDADPNPNSGSYTQIHPNWFQIDIADSTATAPDLYGFLIQNDVAGMDYYAASRSYGIWSGPGTSNGLNVSMSMILMDSTQSALITDHLTTAMPPLAAWDVKKIQIASHAGNPNMFIEGELTSMSIAPVPEPASLGVILIGAASFRRLKKRK